MSEWFERDNFWSEFAAVMFTPDRWAKTPEGVDRLLERLQLPAGARILDLCCGPGRHSLELARRGYVMTGVDRTAAYLEEAARRAAADRLEIEWVREDMRRFLRPESFDGAINLYTSFGFFEDPEDDLLVARNLLASLRPGGRLLLDLQGKEPLARSFRPRDWHWLDPDRGVILLEERRLFSDWGRIEFTWTLVTETERRSETIRLRLYSGTEMSALLHRAGFTTVQLFGGLDGRPYDHEAARLVAVATKRE
jgi:SAM-dependent methyltransferase